MRHVVGFLAGLILAPVILLGSGWAFARLTGLNRDGAAFLSTSGLVTLAGMCGLALLLALLMVPPRLTPLLPGVAGLSLAGFTAIHVLRPEILERLPSLPGLGGAITLTGLGLYLPLGLALIVPMFAAARWSRREMVEENLASGEYLDGIYEDGEEAQLPRRGGRRRKSG
ncbi:hypothetical protein [Allosalinactinospora lopnorensis]|uniref:hypothetical protein n=1 Tax=Allosalinactinospora lopnorensis TaxID=1352348 RepID=UPI000623CAEB|nr:hypothetical protein [Allosalinactinospora lopnorensis]